MYKEIFDEYGSRNVSPAKKELWGIILAGGDGNRLKNFIEKLYGYHRPKQYCRLTGNKSLIQHTLNRTQILIPKNRLVTIANKYHVPYLVEELNGQSEESVILQPENRDTCAGILLPVLKIYKQNKNAVVATFPSDHFIQDAEKFMQYVQDAYDFVKQNGESIVMLGVKPDRKESGYGWIGRGNENLKDGKKISRVMRFIEKPTKDETDFLFNTGSLWNTFVLVGSAASFIKYIRKYACDVYDAFENIIDYMGTPRESEIIQKEFPFVPAVNFSQYVLERIPEHLYVLEVSDVYWNDWGEEHRIINDLKKFVLNNHSNEDVLLNINPFVNSKLNELIRTAP